MTTVSGPTPLAAPKSIGDVDAAWLTRALNRGPVTALAATSFGSGNMATTARLEISWATAGTEPTSLVAKLPAADPVLRRTALDWRVYEIEAAFYTSIAPNLVARVPRCYWAGFDAAEEAYAVVLEDLGALRPGNDLDGCDVHTADAGLRELALLHAAGWGDPTLAAEPWLNRYPSGNLGTQGAVLQRALPVFLDVCSADLSPEVVDLICRFVAAADGYDSKGAGQPRAIVHGDCRLDNVLIGPDRVCILDWQTVHLGAALNDVSYFLCAALPIEERRSHEQSLVRSYHQRLTSEGVSLSWNECWREYRRHAFTLLTSSLRCFLSLELEDRAVAVFRALAERAAWHALDLQSEDLLVDSGTRSHYG